MKKNIYHFNASVSGGPGNVMKDIISILEKDGYTNYVFTPRNTNELNYYKIGSFNFYFSRIISKTFEKISKLEVVKESLWPEVYCSNKIKLIKKLKLPNPDFIILYWYKNFLNHKTIESLFKEYNCDIFIYLMDFAPLTGACHYNMHCQDYKLGCERCPAVKNSIFKNIIHRNAKETKDMYKKCKVTLICPTMESMSFANESAVVPPLNKILLNIPVKKLSMKQITIPHLNNEKKYILLGAQNYTVTRKGSKYSLEILNNLYKELPIHIRDTIEIIVAGEMNSSFQCGFKVHFVGYLTINELYYVYSICNIFLSTSTADMGPMMINQAIAHGLPVASFNVGVAKDLIIDNETGYISSLYDSESLVKKLYNHFHKPHRELKIMKQSCLKIYEEKLSANHYEQIIREIFKGA